MKRSAILFAVFVCLLAASFVCATSEEQIQLRFQIYTITGDMSEDTSLEERIWNAGEDGWRKVRDAVTLFDRGRFRLGKDRLEIDDEACFWNKTELTFTESQNVTLPHDRIRRIYSPSVLLEKEKSSTIRIHSDQSLEYFVKREDGLFALKQMEVQTGLEIMIRPKEERNRVVMDDIVITMHIVGGRERIPGLSLPVGPPVLETHQYKLALRVRFHKNYGILLRPERAQGVILILFNTSAITQNVLETIKREMGDVSYDIKRKTRDGETVYEVDTWIGGRHIEINVFSDGTILSKHEEMNLDELPKLVQDSIAMNLGGAEIDEIQKRTSAAGLVYRVEADQDGKDITLTMGEDGTVLDRDVDED